MTVSADDLTRSVAQEDAPGPIYTARRILARFDPARAAEEGEASRPFRDYIMSRYGLTAAQFNRWPREHREEVYRLWSERMTLSHGAYNGALFSEEEDRLTPGWWIGPGIVLAAVVGWILVRALFGKI